MIHDNTDQTSYVPEVDAASLRDVSLPDTEATPPAPDTDASAWSLPADPSEAMRRLPPALAGHIQDLIAQADAEGYLRGRNEQIEATQHFDDGDDETEPEQLAMPRYGRRSIWDITT